MKFLIRLLVNALAVFILAYVLDDVKLDNYYTALIVTVVLCILNTLVKPLLTFLTFPITILTLGLFYFVINGIIILLADHFIDDFTVKSIWTAIIFSILLSILQWVFQLFLKKD